MANKRHLAVLRRGASAWNAWREANPNLVPDFSHVDWGLQVIHGFDLSHVDLSEALLVHAEVSDVNLEDANLTGARLNGAIFSKCDLLNTRLTKADLTDASLFACSLRGTRLDKATLVRTFLLASTLIDTSLTGSDMTAATLGRTVLASVDLRSVRGLDTIKHQSPSTIGIDTIHASRGAIPEAFFRGAGVPDEFVRYARSPTTRAAKFYSCFLSYSSKDSKFCRRLYADLQANNVRCWFAPEDLKIGDRFRRNIEASIRTHDKLLLVLSEQSVASSWVETEVESAIEKEQRYKRLVLFPIRLDDTIMETDNAWAADIRRTRHIGDFRRWRNDDQYQRALRQLLRDLKQQPNE